MPQECWKNGVEDRSGAPRREGGKLEGSTNQAVCGMRWEQEKIKRQTSGARTGRKIEGRQGRSGAMISSATIERAQDQGTEKYREGGKSLLELK